MKFNLKSIFIVTILATSLSQVAQGTEPETNLPQPTLQETAQVPADHDIKGTIKKPTEEQKASVKYLKPKKSQARGRPTSTEPTK